MSNTRDITLQWKDPNIIEKGYKVYRSKEPMDINNMPEAIASLEKNSTEYIDKDQTIGDTNYYRVSAWIDGYEVYSDEYVLEVDPHTHKVLVGDNRNFYMVDVEGNYELIIRFGADLYSNGDIVVDSHGYAYISEGHSNGEIYKVRISDGVIADTFTVTRGVYHMDIVDNVIFYATRFARAGAITTDGELLWEEDFSNLPQVNTSISRHSQCILFHQGFLYIGFGGNTSSQHGNYVVKCNAYTGEYIFHWFRPIQASERQVTTIRHYQDNKFVLEINSGSNSSYGLMMVSEKDNTFEELWRNDVDKYNNLASHSMVVYDGFIFVRGGFGNRFIMRIHPDNGSHVETSESLLPLYNPHVGSGAIQNENFYVLTHEQYIKVFDLDSMEVYGESLQRVPTSDRLRRGSAIGKYPMVLKNILIIE